MLCFILINSVLVFRTLAVILFSDYCHLNTGRAARANQAQVMVKRIRSHLNSSTVWPIMCEIQTNQGCFFTQRSFLLLLLGQKAVWIALSVFTPLTVHKTVNTSDARLSIIGLGDIRFFTDTRVFRIPSFRTKPCGQRSFSHQARVIWNQLPVSVRHSTSASSFKSSLKTFLFLKIFFSVSLP